MRIASTLILLTMIVVPVAHGAQLDTCEPVWHDDFRAPSFDDDVWSLCEHEGSIHAGGAMLIAGGTPAPGLAEWDGEDWSRVDMGQGGGVWTIESIDDGNGPVLYAAGYDSSFYRRGIWCKDANGVRPIAEIDDDDGFVWALEWFDGKLYAAGNFDLDGLGAYGERETVACWDGEAWTRPGGEDGALEGRGYDLAVFDDGTGPALYAVGSFVGHIARWDGTEWQTSVGGGLNGPGRSLEVFDDGTGERLYVSGDFTMAGGVPARGVAGWDGAAWSALGDGLPSEGFRPRNLAGLVDDTGPVLYASVDGKLSAWDGATWTTIVETDEYILALLAVGSGPDARLYVGGSFEEIGGVTAQKIAVWDREAFAPTGSADSGNAPDRDVTDFAIYKPKSARRADVYACGLFESVGGVPTCDVARFDGRRWLPVGDSESGCTGYSTARALAVFDEGDGDMLFAGGWFDLINGVPASGIARWDGATWADVGGGIGGTEQARVNALLTYDDGTGPCLVVGGVFETAGGVVAHNIARWDGERWAGFGDGIVSPYRAVNALAVFDAGDGPMLYVAGRFETATDQGNVCRWTGTTWEDVSSDSFTEIDALTTFDDGTGPALYAGARFNLGLLRYDGSTWTSVVASPVRVSAFAQLDIDGVPHLVVGGWLDSIGGVPLNSGVALWDGRTWVPLDGGVSGLAEGLLADPTRGALWVGGTFFEVGTDDTVSYKVARWGCPICLSDLSDDGSVGWADLMYLLASWGSCDGCREDLDDDGTVGFGDLMDLLAAWGPCP